MTTIELKTNFHYLIDVIQDDKMLRDLYDCVADFAVKSDVKLTNAQIERMKDSMGQVQKNELISNKQVQENLKQWLTR